MPVIISTYSNNRKWNWIKDEIEENININAYTFEIKIYMMLTYYNLIKTLIL